MKFEYLAKCWRVNGEGKKFFAPCNLGGYFGRIETIEEKKSKALKGIPETDRKLRSRDSDPLIGKEVSIYWPSHDDYLTGWIKKRSKEKDEGTHHVFYPCLLYTSPSPRD